MKCPECGFEAKSVLYDARLGAMFVVKDSNTEIPIAWPAALGLRKYARCIEFGIGELNGPQSDSKNDWGAVVLLDNDACETVFFGEPEQGEAWLVTPGKGYYNWERVDEYIDFTEHPV